MTNSVTQRDRGDHLPLSVPPPGGRLGSFRHETWQPLTQSVFKESVEDQSPRMLGVIRDQCLTKINRMKDEDDITVE